MAGYKPRWFTRPQTVTHPSTNWAQHRITSLIKINALPVSQAMSGKFCSYVYMVKKSGFVESEVHVVCFCVKDVSALYHVESIIILHSSGALMNFVTQQRYKFLNYNQSQTSKVCHPHLELCAGYCIVSLYCVKFISAKAKKA